MGGTHDHDHPTPADQAESSSTIGAPPELLERIVAGDDDYARQLEGEAVRATDNGWQEGDPLDQPDNPPAWQEPAP